jgi:hypothetical protein
MIAHVGWEPEPSLFVAGPRFGVDLQLISSLKFARCEKSHMSAQKLATFVNSWGFLDKKCLKLLSQIRENAASSGS